MTNRGEQQLREPRERIIGYRNTLVGKVAVTGKIGLTDRDVILQAEHEGPSEEPDLESEEEVLPLLDSRWTAGEVKLP